MRKIFKLKDFDCILEFSSYKKQLLIEKNKTNIVESIDFCIIDDKLYQIREDGGLIYLGSTCFLKKESLLTSLFKK